MSDQDMKAVGWLAIDKALKVLYPDQEAKHYGTLISYEAGGDDPLCGISVYKRELPVPHWHFITYGFSELYETKEEKSDVSGFGFELTFRLAREEGEYAEPRWALRFLQKLARYVFDSGNVFRVGHYLHANGPIAHGEETCIRSVAFIADPELPVLETPNGSVEFLQIVGLTEDEELALKQWTAIEALEVFHAFMPLYVTYLKRSSLLEKSEVRQAIQQGAQRDGSSTGSIFANRLMFASTRLLGGSVYTVTLGDTQVSELLMLLALRLPFGRDFGLVGVEETVWFAPSTRCSVSETDDGIGIHLTEEALAELLSTLKPESGHYTLKNFKGLVFDIEPAALVMSRENLVMEPVG